jgi:phytanoyl-CoA hydroxylase
MTAQNDRFAPTPAEMRQWEEQGFLVRENVFSADECDDLAARAERLARDESLMPEVRRRENALTKERGAGPKVMHSVTRPHIYDDTFRAHLRDPRVTDVLAHILSPDLVTHNTLFLFKAPGVGLPFPWHQDMWFFGKRFQTPTTVGTWQAMDDAYIENGCLWVIPGSHRWPILEHDLPADGPQQQEFRLARLPDPEEEGVPVEIPKGSVLWFHGHLLHRSGHNHTENHRRTYVAHYLSAHARYANPAAGRNGEPVAWVRGETPADGVHAEPDATLREADRRWAAAASAGM